MRQPQRGITDDLRHTGHAANLSIANQRLDFTTCLIRESAAEVRGLFGRDIQGECVFFSAKPRSLVRGIVGARIMENDHGHGDGDD